MKLYFVFFVPLLFVAFLLFTNHLGIAIKITNYIFYILILFAIWKLNNEKK